MLCGQVASVVCDYAVKTARAAHSTPSLAPLPGVHRCLDRRSSAAAPRSTGRCLFNRLRRIGLIRLRGNSARGNGTAPVLGLTAVVSSLRLRPRTPQSMDVKLGAFLVFTHVRITDEVVNAPEVSTEITEVIESGF